MRDKLDFGHDDVGVGAAAQRDRIDRAAGETRRTVRGAHPRVKVTSRSSWSTGKLDPIRSSRTSTEQGSAWPAMAVIDDAP
jgi:hypothetical protein